MDCYRKTLFDVLSPLNDMVVQANANIKAGVNTETNATILADVERYLKPDIERGIVYRTNAGDYRPRYCEYCRWKYGQLHRPRFVGYTLNMGEKFWEIAHKKAKDGILFDDPTWKSWKKDSKERLLKEGVPTGSMLLDVLPWADGTSYAMWCPHCEQTTEFWRDSLYGAELLFDEKINKSLKQYLEQVAAEEEEEED